MRLYVVPSREVEEKLEEEPKLIGKGNKCMKKVDTTQPKHVFSIHPTLPPPPPPPPPNMTQNDRGQYVLHLDDIALTLSPS